MTNLSDLANARRFNAWLLAGAAVAMLGVLAAVVFCVKSASTLRLVACWNDHFHSSLLADNLLSKRDRQSLFAGGYFDVDETTLDSLSKGQPFLKGCSEPCVVYLSANIVLRDDGEVLLMTEEFDPITAQGGVLLEAVLDRVEANSTPTLLVLDLSWGHAEGLAGLLPDNAGAVVHQRLRLNPPKNCLTIVSCAPGETPTKLEHLSRTTFGYFFEAGLAGAADGFNDSGVTDGKVSAKEIALYVREQVTSWSYQHCASHQTPRLFGADRLDFTVVSTRRSQQTLPNPEEIDAYPEWLLEAWRRRDTWRENGQTNAIPRLVKRYEAELMEAERHWRSYNAVDNCARWETSSRSVLQEIDDALRQLSATPAVTLSQLPGAVDRSYVSAWLALFAATDKQDAAAAFAKATESAAYEPLAQAALFAVVESGELLPVALNIATDELSIRSKSPQFLEIADMRLLADAAERRPDINAATLAKFLRVAMLRSQVAAEDCLPQLLSEELYAANESRQSAWAILMSPGYGSLDDACELNDEALTGYQSIIARHQLLLRAHQTADNALLVLPAMAPLLKCKPADFNDWNAAAADTNELMSLLGSEFDPDDESVDAVIGRLEEKLSNLTEAVCTESIGLLAEELQAGNLAREPLAEALLTTPLLKADDRAKLVTGLRDASAKLVGSLHAFANQRPPRVIGPALTRLSGVEDADEERESREIAIALATLRLAGLLSEESSQAVAGAPTPSEFRAILEEVYDLDYGKLPSGTRDRACSVLPPHPFVPLLDRHGQTPTLLTSLAHRNAWARQFASRIHNAARDLHDPSPYLELARRLDADATAKSVWLHIDGVTDQSPVILADLSSQQPTESLTLHVDHQPDQLPNVRIFQPADCLSIDYRREASSSGSLIKLTIRLREDATVADKLATQGVLLCLQRGAEVCHRRVATPELAAVAPVELLVEVAGVRLPWGDRLDLPPTDKPTAMRLIAVNHSDREIALQADLDSGVSLHSEARLAASSETLLMFQQASPAAEGVVSLPMASTLSLRLREGDKQLLNSTALLGVADPSEYLRVLDARYVSNGSAAPRVKFVVERLEGSPNPLNLAWSITSRHQPDESLISGGVLAAKLTPESPIATFEAVLAGHLDAMQRIHAIADINGAAKAVAIVNENVAGQRTSTFSRSKQTSLELVAPTVIASGTPLLYSIDAQSAPADVRIETTLVSASSDDQASSVAFHRYPAPRRHAVTVTAPAKPGDVMVLGTIGAWEGTFDTTGLSGRWRINAVAINSKGVVVGCTASDVTIDGEAPSHLELTALTPLVSGKPATFRIDATDELSGVAGVRVYLGEPSQGAPPAEAKPIVAAPLKDQPDAWSAALLLPAATTALVTVEVTDLVGKVRSQTQQLVLLDEATASLGSVAGTVVEGALPQPNLTVELRDPQQQPIASSKTDANGAFHFAGVKPGKYVVWSVKAASQRVDAAAVDVQSGAEAKVNLKLSL